MSHGEDGVTILELSREWPKRGKLIRERILNDRYHFSPLRPVAIPKDDSKPLSLDNARPISILNTADRVVQRAMLRSLWKPLRDLLHSKVSFGGIRRYHLASKEQVKVELPRKSTRLAIETIARLQDSGYGYVFETDIISFFDNIDRDKLMEKIRRCLSDQSIDRLLQSAVDAEIVINQNLKGYQHLWSDGVGVPQGSVLSPILANLYLHDFDESVICENFEMVRYIDDLVILTKDLQEARRAHEFVKDSLDSVGLSIHPIGEQSGKAKRIKTQIREPNESFEFLGVAISATRILPASHKWRELRDKIELATDFRLRKQKSFVDVVMQTNAIVRGWVNSFSHCNITPGTLEKNVDSLVRDRLAGWLNRARVRRSKTSLTTEEARHLGVKSACSVEIKPIRLVG